MVENSIRTQLRIDWSEIDYFGHINNLAILRYAQTSRLNYLEQNGMMQFHRETGIGPVLASTSCQFKKQLFYPGEVTVLTHVEHFKTTSFHMRHVVLNHENECVAEMVDILVMFDYKNNKKHVIQDIFRPQVDPASAVPTA